MDQCVLKQNSCYFPALPFYWRSLTDNIKDKFPATLPFELYLDEHTGLLRQKPDAHVRDVLNESYKQGTYVEALMDAQGTGQNYARDFLDFIDRAIGLNHLASKKILEIGCGTGYLLSELRNFGADVLGYEPGFGKIGKFDVPVLEEFFPTLDIQKSKFDVVIAFGVLEHIDDPQHFLKNIQEHLTQTGMVIISVPDCQEHVSTGDVSMLIHEHYSYFTPETLKEFLKANGFLVKDLTRSGFGGSIYAACVCDDARPKDLGKQQHNTPDTAFFVRMRARLERFGAFLSDHRGQTIGVYVPMRAFNTLFLLKDILIEHNIKLRFFDDSERLQGRCAPGFDIPIENQQALLDVPCAQVLIFSYSFAQTIAKRLKAVLPSDVSISTMEDI